MVEKYGDLGDGRSAVLRTEPLCGVSALRAAAAIARKRSWRGRFVKNLRPTSEGSREWMIWSHYHNAWHCRSSKGGACGYTNDIAGAGLFDRATASSYNDGDRNEAFHVSEKLALIHAAVRQHNEALERLLFAIAAAARQSGDAKQAPSEEWRSVADYEGLYEVSSDGAVRSLHKREPKVMVGRVDRYGYHTVLLSKNGVERRMKTHRLVCRAFSGEPPPDYVAAHLDGVRSNNRRENLIWATTGENARHQIAHGTSNLIFTGMPGTKNPNAKLTNEQVAYLREAASTGRSTRSIAREMGINQSRVVRIKNGESYAAESASPDHHTDNHP